MKNSLIALVLICVAGFGVWLLFGNKQATSVTNFEECVLAGNPVMESYPRQCRTDSETYTEFIGNELEKTDLIRIESPRPNQLISSPFTITGQARGNWFFEASFPVMLTDWDGKIIAQGIATAKSEWMTTDFVPFEATLSFVVEKDIYSRKGTLILQKDNPSGLPENDDALEIPVVFAETAVNSNSSTTLEAGIGETVTGGGVTLTPLALVSDSRCAIDVQCVWAGTTEVKVRIQSGLGTSEMTLGLGTPVTTEVEEITLTEVGPVPAAGVEIPPASYRFTFEVKAR